MSEEESEYYTIDYDYIDNYEQFFTSDTNVLTKSSKNSFLTISNNSILINQDFLDFNILKYLPRTFTITTNNSSGKFNLDLLIYTSSIISNFIKTNPNSFSYHLDVKDSMNVLGKFELMYQGKKILFKQEDLPISIEITQILKIKSCPTYLKQKDKKSCYSSPDLLKQGIVANPVSYIRFLKNRKFENFTISTKNRQYKCNSYGVYYSNVIKELLIKNPTIDHFEYDYDDEFEEFHTVCSFFNFHKVQLTKDNIYFLKETAENLKILNIIPIINEQIAYYEKYSQRIDNQQNLVDSIEELFGWLYDIEKLKTETVKELIVNSFWSKKDDDVRELAAFIIHVIKTNLLLHPKICDLLLLLQKEANESNGLKVLIPSIVSHLMPIMKEKTAYCSFIYSLHKKGIISKEHLIKEIKSQYSSRTENLFAWFLPELIENKILHINYLSTLSNNKKIIEYDIEEEEEEEEYNDRRIRHHKRGKGLSNKKKIIEYDVEEEEEEYGYYYDKIKYRNKKGKGLINKKIIYKFDNDDRKSRSFYTIEDFVSFYYPDKMDQYKLMRDNREPDVELSRSLINDDVDKLQAIINISRSDFTRCSVPFDIFTPNKGRIVDKYSYINYAAMFGSIKCFKYLLLNHAKFDEHTFPCAIKGGNIEIIKITDEKSLLGEKIIIKALKITIKKHQNDIFDWLFENKLSKESKRDFLMLPLVQESAKFCNAHSFIEIVSRFNLNLNDYKKEIFEEPAKNGFYRFFQLIVNLNDKELIDGILIRNTNNYPFISSGNLSIFKLSLTFKNTRSCLEKVLLIAVENNYRSIIDYFFSNLINKVFIISENGAYEALKLSIKSKSNELINLLMDNFLSLCPSLFVKSRELNQLLELACINKNVDLVKRLTEIILLNDPNEKLGHHFVKAASVGSIEICKYFIDKMVFIDHVSLNDLKLDSVNIELFSLIIDNLIPEYRAEYIDYFLEPAISCNNKEIVDYLLNKGSPIQYGLFVAVSSGFIDIIDVILKYYNKPSFVNKMSINGSILHIAINNSKALMVKRILKIPGINPLLYNKQRVSAITMAISSKNIEIVDAIIDFYCENNSSEKKILDEIAKSTIDLFSKENHPESIVIYVLERVLQIKGIDPNFVGSKYTFLSYSCKIGNLKFVKMLLDMDNIDVNTYSPNDGNTPLIIAVDNNHIEIANLLIKDKRTNINSNNYYDETALTIAVKKKLSEVVDHLINDEKFDPEESHLDYAFFKAYDQIAVQLSSLKSLDVNCPLRNKETTLIDAVASSNYEKIDLILKHPSFDLIKSHFKEAVYISIQNSDDKVFKKLIKLTKTDINISIDSKSILLLAAKFQSLKIIKIILKNPNFDSSKSDILNAFLKVLKKININRFGEEEEENEVKGKSLNILDILVKFDKKHGNLINMKKLLPNGKSFFTYAKHIYSPGKYTRYLIKHGANPNMPDKDGVYPLEHAIAIGDENYVHKLIDSHKIDFNKKTIKKPLKPGLQPTEKNETFLHLAAKINDKRILQLFLDMKIFDINAKDDSGETPLMKACRYGIKDNIKLLFDNKNLDYLHCNNEGKDALAILKSVSINRIHEDKIKDKGEYKKELLRLIEINSTENRNNSDYSDFE